MGESCVFLKARPIGRMCFLVQQDPFSNHGTSTHGHPQKMVPSVIDMKIPDAFQSQLLEIFGGLEVAWFQLLEPPMVQVPEDLGALEMSGEHP